MKIQEDKDTLLSFSEQGRKCEEAGSRHERLPEDPPIKIMYAPPGLVEAGHRVMKRIAEKGGDGVMKSKLQKLLKLTRMKLYGERHQARKKQKQRKQLCECVIPLGGTGHPGAIFVANKAAEEVGL